MLSHKRIKQIILQYKPGAVRRGQMYVGSLKVDGACKDLERETEEMALEGLHAEMANIEERITQAQNHLTSLSLTIQTEEVKRIKAGGEFPSRRNDLEEYVQWYNEFKISHALLETIKRIISESYVGQSRKAVRSAGVQPKEKVNHSKGQHQNEFIRSGEGWLVRFLGGKQNIFLHRIGMTYIARLLDSPNETVHCVDLIHLAGGQKGDTPELGQYGEAVLMTEGMTISDRERMVEVSDDRATLEYRREIDRITRTLREKSTSKLQRKELEENKRLLENLLRGSKKGRIVSQNDKRMMNSVSKAISDCIRAMKSHDPRLASHLGDSIDTGMYVVYKSVDGLIWRVETDMK